MELHVSVLLTLMLTKLFHETNWKHAPHQLSHFNFRENQLLGRTGTTEAWGFIVADLKIFSVWVASKETTAVTKVWFLLFYKLFAKSGMERSCLKENIYWKKTLYIFGFELTVGVWFMFIDLWLPFCAAAMPLLKVSEKNTVSKRQSKPDSCMKLKEPMLSHILPLHLLS